MGQANASPSTKAIVNTAEVPAAAAMVQAKPVTAKELEDISESESDEAGGGEGEGAAPVSYTDLDRSACSPKAAIKIYTRCV